MSFFGAEPAPTKPQGVLPITTSVVPHCTRKRQGVLDHYRVAPNKRVLSNPAELVYPRVRPQRRVVFNDHVAGKRSSIREDYVTADSTVVGDVRLSHYEVVIAEFRDIAAAFGSPLKRREFSKRVSLSRAQHAPLSTILQILRRLSGRNKRIENRPASELGGTLDYTMTAYSNVVVQDHIIADYRVWADNYILSEFCLWAYDCCRVKGHFRGSLLRLFDGSKGGGAAYLITAFNYCAIDQGR